MLARHYPPAISGGAKRPYLLAQALRDLGAEVRVCAPSLPPGEPGWAVPHPNRDPPTSNSDKEQFSLRAIARELLLWPDPDIRWSMHAANKVIADSWRPDWVLSTSPPESIHFGGAKLARATGAKWAADFRDLWLSNPHRRERRCLFRRLGERHLSRRLLPKADLVLAVDPVIAEEVVQLGARKAEVLPHFVSDKSALPATLPSSTLNVVHAGSISLSDPEADLVDLLGPFEAAHARNAALRLHLVGRLTDLEQKTVAASPAAKAIHCYGPKSLDEALSFIAGADALIFVASKKMHVPPSKITDYLSANVPIVACGVGPWTNDPRVPRTDPTETLARLARGSKRNVDCPPPTASETATKLLMLLNS